LGRTLYYLERNGVYDCEICGFPHIHHDPSRAYRAVVVASEPITHEPWQEVPEGSLYAITPDLKWRLEPLL
jgi:predicted glutamine amidotransferase